MKYIKAKDYNIVFAGCTTFSDEIEQQLEDQILNLEECFYGHTIKDIHRATFDYAEQNEIKNNFNKSSRMGGKKWFYQFMERHPNISLCQPEATFLTISHGV